MADPRGLVVAITGGARGIGAATAATLAEAGATVAIGDIDGEAAAATAAELPGAIGLPLDVTDAESHQRFLDAVAQRLGAVDVLVANAGVMWVGRFEDEPVTATRRMFAVNVEGVINGMRLATPAMRKRGRGQIVVVASVASRLAPRGEASYAATKHAVLGYCTAVRQELHRSGVDVSVLMPTVVETDLAAGTSSGIVKRLPPRHVADAVLSLVRRPRPELYLPKHVGVSIRFLDLVPARLRGFCQRLLVVDQTSSDPGTREDYQRRSLE
ncbi:SDR family NAD(P)-dependent oxidoreductase [Haloechinothrix halophila]|uniref:SDR family NAD(P)-dependent oxidoreductase n=1 Tax=Haloechinothrix halophila TaxID=1069073 RepID=UPI0004173BE2|nr:SDR family NAD(P)-dependent oxidoreductase [Haloechinothrix halophila]